MMSKEEFEKRFAENFKSAKLKDRGNKKWTAMMLTEHVTELRKNEENYDKVERPQLDEYDLQAMQEEIDRAMASKSETRFTTWLNGTLHYHRGVLEKVNRDWLVYEDPFGSHRINTSELVSVVLLE